MPILCKRLAAAAFALCASAAGVAAAVAYGERDSLAADGPGFAEGYAETCERGNASYAAHDVAGAIASYRKAIAQDPSKPLGYYLLGEAELGAGRLAEAEAALRTALSASQRDPSMHARTLFVVASLEERRKRWTEARAAWQAYLDWVGRFPDSGAFAANARSRQRAIDRMAEGDRASEGVRRRIRETSEGGVFSNVSGDFDGGD